MHAVDLLEDGQRTFLAALERVPQRDWEIANVCGYWSIRQIMAHLASYEALIADVLTGIAGGGETATLDRYRNDPGGFNEAEVERRSGLTTTATLDELESEYQRVMSSIGDVPAETLREPGTIPWYGPEYSIDDLIVYQAYGHKREHAAQICVFADRLAR